jgi:hypothetical protein
MILAEPLVFRGLRSFWNTSVYASTILAEPLAFQGLHSFWTIFLS